MSDPFYPANSPNQSMPLPPNQTTPTFPQSFAPATAPSSQHMQQEAPGQPMRRTNRRFIMTLSVIIIVFLLLGGGLLFAGYNTAQAALQPAQVVQAFCDALQAQRYPAAYALLSPQYQAKKTTTQFAQASQLQDQVDGKIRGCPTATGNVIDLSFNAPKDRTAFLLTILRNNSFTGHIALVQHNGTWRVDAVERSLQGTNLGPLLVVKDFCTALTKGDFNGAYQTLSSRQQGLATEQQFTQQFTAAFGGLVKITNCDMNYASYAVQANAATINVTLDLTISTPTAGTITSKLPTVFTLRLDNTTWRLDEFAPQGAV